MVQTEGVDLSRRALLRGDVRSNVIRPPWAINQTAFTNKCTSCGDCVAVCQEAIIRQKPGHYPYIDFSFGECTFCGECEKACQTGALSREASPEPWQQTAVIKSDCLANQNIVCRSCADVCEQEAIRFQWGNRGVSLPQLTADQCNGCGACVKSCPTGSISVIVDSGDLHGS